RLGMDEEIVERAKELVSSENALFEDVVQSLETSRQKLEAERAQTEKARLEAERARQEAEKIRDSIQKKADQELEKARRQASELVSRTRGQIDALLNEMEELKKQRDKMLSAEQKAKLKSGLRSLEETADPVHSREEQGAYVLPRPLKVGDTVLIYDIDKQGTVLQLPEGNGQNVLVQAGIIQTRVPLSNLRLVEKKKTANKPRRTVTRSMPSRAEAKVTTECDLRGQTVEEAIMNVDRFIDSALLSGIEQLTIIHGKGTGTLRAAVQQHLKRHPNVRTYRLGTFGEGEAGVTIVELK
ncbi:MAG: endonuclease MutS2, partial [Clostridiales bacterium]|nr:endonuclease MutS2 [Clostridiales bacterium]